MKKRLFICNSIYQLMNIVNICYTTKRDDMYESDLILTDITIALKDYIDNIKKTNIFTHILYANTYEINNKYSTLKGNDLIYGFKKFENILNATIQGVLTKYSEIYFANFDFFTRLIAYAYQNDDCQFIGYEDGFSSYVINFLDYNRANMNQIKEGVVLKDKITQMLLYEPKLSLRNDKICNNALKKIDKNDQKIIDMLNLIFSYKKNKIQHDFIFLEQSFRTEGIKSNDVELIRECSQIIGTENFVVKPHPRNLNNVSISLGLSNSYNSDVPWELFLLNEEIENKTVITVCSNAALSSRIILGININTVMLYKLFNGRVLWKEDKILKQYLDVFHKHYSVNNYYVPETVYQLRNTIKYLLNN